MVAKINASRQTTGGHWRKLFGFERLAHAIVKGVLRLNSRCAAFIGAGIFLLGCSGSEVKKPLPQGIVQKDCDEIATFLAVDAVKLSDLSKVRDQAAKLLERTRTLENQDCGPLAKLERLVRQIDLRYPSDPAWIQAHAVTEKLAQSLQEKSDAFKWQLPGDKRAGTRETFLKRLANTADREKRQSIYKLYNSSRSRRWLSWGFKDLLQARTAEAKAAGFSSFPEYALRKAGHNVDQLHKVLELVRDKIGPSVKREIKKLADANSIPSLEPWDLYFLMERSWGGNLTRPLPPSLPQDYAKVFLNGLGLSADNGTLLIDPPLVKTDMGVVVARLALESYQKNIQNPFVIFQRPSEGSKEAIAESMKWLALDSPLLAPTLQKAGVVAQAEVGSLKPMGFTPFAWSAYRYAWLAEFERKMYDEPDADLLEMWSALSRDYWGIEVPTFYGGFDEDDYLRSPFSAAEKVIGALSAVGIVKVGYGDFSENLGPGFGARLKTEWFQPGSELLTLELLKRFARRDYDFRVLIDELADSFK